MAAPADVTSIVQHLKKMPRNRGTHRRNTAMAHRSSTTGLHVDRVHRVHSWKTHGLIEMQQDDVGRCADQHTSPCILTEFTKNCDHIDVCLPVCTVQNLAETPPSRESRSCERQATIASCFVLELRLVLVTSFQRPTQRSWTDPPSLAVPRGDAPPAAAQYAQLFNKVTTHLGPAWM